MVETKDRIYILLKYLKYAKYTKKKLKYEKIINKHHYLL